MMACELPPLLCLLYPTNDLLTGPFETLFTDRQP